jgi:hypothetical protein
VPFGPLAANQAYDFFCSGQYNGAPIDIAATVSSGTPSEVLSSAQGWISGSPTLSSATTGANYCTTGIMDYGGIGCLDAIDGPTSLGTPVGDSTGFPFELSGTFETNTTAGQSFYFSFGSLTSATVNVTALSCNLNPTPQ